MPAKLLRRRLRARVSLNLPPSLTATGVLLRRASLNFTRGVLGNRWFLYRPARRRVITIRRRHGCWLLLLLQKGKKRLQVGLDLPDIRLNFHQQREQLVFARLVHEWPGRGSLHSSR